jgi:hypothetical protein
MSILPVDNTQNFPDNQPSSLQGKTPASPDSNRTPAHKYHEE